MLNAISQYIEIDFYVSRGLGSEAPQGAKRKPKASGMLAAEGEAFPLPNRAVGAICGRYGKP